MAYEALAALLVVTDWLTESRHPVEAQAVSTASEWPVVSENVAGIGGISVIQNTVRLRGQAVSPVERSSYRSARRVGELCKRLHGRMGCGAERVLGEAELCDSRRWDRVLGMRVVIDE